MEHEEVTDKLLVGVFVAIEYKVIHLDVTCNKVNVDDVGKKNHEDGTERDCR